MAGIKIEKPDGTPSTAGYIEVAKKIFTDPDAVFEELAEYSNNELIAFLMDFNIPAPGPNERTVTVDDGRPLKPRNAVVTARYDDVERTRRGKPRVTINLPKDNPANLSYLQPFITALASLGSDSEKRHFLMGMLVLTKCR